MSVNENEAIFTRNIFTNLLITGWLTFSFSSIANFGFYKVHPRKSSKWAINVKNQNIFAKTSMKALFWKFPCSGVDCTTKHLEKKFTFYIYGCEKAIWNPTKSLKDHCFIHTFHWTQNFQKIMELQHVSFKVASAAAIKM